MIKELRAKRLITALDKTFTTVMELQLLLTLKNIEKVMLINQVLFKFIMDWLMTQRDILIITFTASNLIPLSMLTTL